MTTQDIKESGFYFVRAEDNQSTTIVEVWVGREIDTRFPVYLINCKSIDETHESKLPYKCYLISEFDKRYPEAVWQGPIQLPELDPLPKRLSLQEIIDNPIIMRGGNDMVPW